MVNGLSLHQKLNTLKFSGTNSDFSVIEKNIKMEVKITNLETDIRWQPIYGNVDFPDKCLYIVFDNNGNPVAFTDKWGLFTIGGTAVNISMEAAANLAWRTLMSSNITSVDVGGIGNVTIHWINNAIVSLRGEVRGNYTESPGYTICFGSDLLYGNGYCAAIGIWADNGQVAFLSQDKDRTLMEPMSKQTP